MRIAFIDQQNAFLPELSAYIDFFSARGINCLIVNKKEAGRTASDVEWHFMGTSFKKKNGITIHEYTSSSTPPFAYLKNLVKKQLNNKPDFRIFLNEFVSEQFCFNDNIPIGFRDMGVNLAQFDFQNGTSGKEFDFIYVGELANRSIERMFELFTSGKLSQRNLLILSRKYEQLQIQYSAYDNIHFAGPIKPKDVAPYIMQSRFGLNLIPNRYPFNQQTSTKLLEYAAAKIPIVTNDYAWVRQFELKYGGAFFYASDDLSNVDWDQINNFSYSWPDLNEWRWEYQIRKSGVLEFLESKFPSLKLTSW